jgi:hypothetical protein
VLTLCLFAAPALAHDEHRHKADDGGKLADLKDAKYEQACTTKGGTWTDHGHTKEEQAAPRK